MSRMKFWFSVSAVNTFFSSVKFYPAMRPLTSRTTRPLSSALCTFHICTSPSGPASAYARTMFHATIVRLTMAAPIPFMAQLNANVLTTCRVIAKFIIAVPSRTLEKQSAYQTQTIDKKTFIVRKAHRGVGNSRKVVKTAGFSGFASRFLIYGRKHKRKDRKPVDDDRPR